MLTLDSLRGRLLGLLLLGLVAAGGAAAVLTYVGAHRGTAQVLDAHLRQGARLLVAQAELDLDELHFDEDDEDYATEVAFQVRRPDGRVLLRSPNAPVEPFAGTSPGFSDAVHEARRWRVFTLADDDGETIVHFAEDDATRELIARRLAVRALVPVAAALPLLVLLVWYVVGRSLRPLDELGHQIARRGADDLRPLSVGLLPAELQPLARRLDALLLRMRDSLDSERRFTSHAAHELRTPVAAIRAQAEVASIARDPAVREAALAHCIEACDRMSRLVSQLLLLARADELGALPQVRPCRIDQIAQSVLAAIAPEALQAGVRVSLDVAGGGEVLGDSALLEALVRNLVDNAVRHGRSDVRVSVGLDGDGRTVLEVVDDGPGVPEEALAQLGRRFYRVAGSPGSGSGLGLSIVARIAQLHDATVRFERGPSGRGLRVRVRFEG